MWRYPYLTDQFGFHEGNSILHRLNPLAKFLSLMLMLLGILIYPSIVVSILFLISLIIGFFAAGISFKVNQKRVQFIFVFGLLLFALQVLVTPNGNILVYLIPEINGLGPFVPITDYGVSLGLIFSLRFLLIVLSSMLFVSITDPTLLAHSFAKCGVSYRYSFALIIALRFLPLFDTESEMIRMAQQSRGITTEIRSIRGISKLLRYTFRPLLVSALSRVDALSMSMDGRGFGYASDRTYVRNAEWRFQDTILVVSLFAYLCICFLLSFGLLQFPVALF
ncbi:MAG: hypothetical protein GF411_00760 [Candidatus Lokiarchaeota archaeon]|nr:hypothetical protein [Candidatus Lokiarchaeota archaeon]